MSSLDLRERVPGIDPRRFWSLAPGLAAWQAMAGKYKALAILAALPEDQRRPKLRDAAGRWPGSLREAELIGPEQVAARAQAAGGGLLSPDRARGSWTDTPSQAVIGWAALHPLLADLRRFRQSKPADPRDPSEFARWIATRDPEERWPEPERILEVVGPVVRVRSAYLWLAAQVGLDLPSLNALLFARQGHWDRRPEDPAWAHAGVGSPGWTRS